MLTIQPAKVEYNGKEYFAELGTITRTKLGREDHGIFTFLLEFDFNGSVQGAGNLALNDPINIGKAVQGLVDFFDTDWEHFKHTDAFVLREESYGLIRGLMNKSQTKAVIFSEWFDE